MSRSSENRRPSSSRPKNYANVTCGIDIDRGDRTCNPHTTANVGYCTLNQSSGRCNFANKPNTNAKYTRDDITRAVRRGSASDHESIERERRHRRWRWQEPCDANDGAHIDELRAWAHVYDVPSYETKTKQELCQELSQMWNAKQDAHRAVHPQCSNPNTLWTQDAIDEIPPEFCYHYTHDGQLYCDDIRSLHRHVNDSQAPQNPYNRVPFRTQQVQAINASYDQLERRAVHLDDFVHDPSNVQSLSFASQFSQRLADLMIRLSHTPGAEQLRRASAAVFLDVFVESLVAEGVLSIAERNQINAQLDLERQKFFLVELLIGKIDQDPHQIPTAQGNLSQIANRVTEVYNFAFA